MVNPDSSMEISAMEAVPLENLDPTAISNALTETGKRVTKDDVEKIEVQIHQDIYQAMNNALAKVSSSK